MNRTWDDNKQAINQLWPVAQFTDEEKRLWNDDLSPLDQDVLYDAIRNAKRSHDSIYPQLKWMLDAYRELMTLRKAALRQTKPHEPKTVWNISDEQDAETRAWLVEWIDRADPSEYRDIYDATFADGTFEKLKSVTAISVLTYARRRLLGEEPRFGRVGDSGVVSPMFTEDGVDGPTPLALRQDA
jgi:hypothetical protein